MRYIDFSIIDTHDPDVKRWIKKASVKLTQLSSLSTHDERKSFLQRNSIWSEFKPILIKYFGDKCWYSECDLTGSYGDVDHFRPKNKSTDENDKVILEDGYWWLAYDYLNYRLSCEKCNRKFEKGGKRERFPLQPGTQPAVAPNKDDLPVILDPCVLQDVQLIDCDESGKIIPLTHDYYQRNRIRISKMVYNWNCFNGARKKVRGECKTALELFELIYNSIPDKLSIPLAQIKRLTDDHTPYSSFSKKYIKNWIEGKPYEEILSSLL